MALWLACSLFQIEHYDSYYDLADHRVHVNVRKASAFGAESMFNTGYVTAGLFPCIVYGLPVLAPTLHNYLTSKRTMAVHCENQLAPLESLCCALYRIV